MNQPKQETPLVSIIVPVHNGKEVTGDFLDSMALVTYPNYKIIIVDDGSTDGTWEMIEKRYPHVTLLRADGSLLWSRCFNLGAKKAKELGAHYILLIDNDTEVDSEFLTFLVDTAQRHPNSIVSSKCYYHGDPTRIYDAGGRLDWRKGGFKQTGQGDIDSGQFDAEREVLYGVMGVLIEHSIFEDVGMLDAEKFPLYLAEIDFMLRAGKKGYHTIFQPKSRIWHKVSMTSRKTLKSRRFISSPIKTLRYCFSPQSHGSPWNMAQLFRFYFRHYPVPYVPYAFAYEVGRRLFRELRGEV